MRLKGRITALCGRVGMRDGLPLSLVGRPSLQKCTLECLIIHFKQQWKEILAIEGGTFIYLHVHLLSLYSRIRTKWPPLKKWKVDL